MVTVPPLGRLSTRLEMNCQKEVVPAIEGWLTCWCFQISYVPPSLSRVPTFWPCAEPFPLLVYSWMLFSQIITRLPSHRRRTNLDVELNQGVARPAVDGDQDGARGLGGATAESDVPERR